VHITDMQRLLDLLPVFRLGSVIHHCISGKNSLVIRDDGKNEGVFL